MQRTIMNYFHLCSYGHSLEIAVDSQLLLEVVFVVVPSMRTGFGWTLRMLTSSYISVDSDLTTHGFTIIPKLYGDYMGGGTVTEMKRETNVTLHKY
jgi:hypothetical protein